jgi:hypothetical protein
MLFGAGAPSDSRGLGRMSGFDPEQAAAASARYIAPAVNPRRHDARIDVSLTEREIRAIIRATTLVADVLRPELLRQIGSTHESPLVTAYQTLTAACERHGIDLGLGRAAASKRS